MMRDKVTDALLKSMDPAEPRRAGTPRSQQDLERILAADAGGADPRSVPERMLGNRRIGSRRLGNRRLVVAAAAAAVTLGIVVVPVAGAGDRAFASWTQTPSALSPEAGEKAGNDCRSSDRNTAEDSSGAAIAIAERRGEWTTVVLAGPGSFSAMCVTDGSFFGGSFGYSGKRPGGAEPAPRGLLPTAMGMGSASAGELSMVVGAAGADVTGVSYASRTEGEVAGSVANGYFVLWFPGDELRNYPSGGVELMVEYSDGSSGLVMASLDWANS